MYTVFLAGGCTKGKGANFAHLNSTFFSHRYNESLLEEGKMMHKLRHQRVVKLLGIIIEEGNYSLVMEYMEKGNLMHVLKTEVEGFAMHGTGTVTWILLVCLLWLLLLVLL